MTTRTVKIFGLAYGSTPAEINVTLDGNTVYTGPVSTLDPVTGTPSLADFKTLNNPTPNLDYANSTVELCSFELPMDFQGSKPMTSTVTNGTVIFAQIRANYCAIANTDPIIGHGDSQYFNINGDADPRSNATKDGILVPVVHTEAAHGAWFFSVNTGSVLSYDLNVIAGTANVAPTPPTP